MNNLYNLWKQLAQKWYCQTCFLPKNESSEVNVENGTEIKTEGSTGVHLHSLVFRIHMPYDLEIYVNGRCGEHEMGAIPHLSPTDTAFPVYHHSLFLCYVILKE